MKRWFAGSCVATMLALGACANPVPGGSASGTTPGSATSSSPTGRTGEGIDLAGFDPCVSITPEQAKTLGLNGPKPQASTGSAKSCNWTHFLAEPIESFFVEGNDRRGIESMNSTGSLFKVGRFDAVDTRSSIVDDDKACGIAIAVRPGQVLLVSYVYSGSIQRMTHDLACEKAKPVAAMVVANLDRGGS